MIMPKNSAPTIIKRQPTEIKSKIKKKTELTVFLEVITISDGGRGHGQEKSLVEESGQEQFRGQKHVRNERNEIITTIHHDKRNYRGTKK